jgi:hypothetical protein
MPHPKLRTCPFLGPGADDEAHAPRILPPDSDTQPLNYLPPRLVLSEAELELASQYERGDFSGGYVTSQIARFRRGPSPESHQRRREKFRGLKAQVHRLGFVLPDSFIQLAEADDFVARLRHNTIWLRLPDEVVPLPSAPDHRLFLIFGEGQGGGYWHLLLAPDGGHVVTFSEHPFGLGNVYLPGYEPDPASFEVFQCAANFPEWIVNYFAECVENDRRYEEMLEKYPGL